MEDTAVKRLKRSFVFKFGMRSIQDMKSRLEACASAFGEETSASPSQVFGAMDSFLTQLAEARAECDAARRRRDEEERRTRHEQEVQATPQHTIYSMSLEIRIL
jgi:hypothetical protein